MIINILRNQEKIKNAIKTFNCTEYNLDQNEMAFDLCAMYMAQIGEAVGHLTDETKNKLTLFDWSVIKRFRNFIDHSYEKINKKLLKTYIFMMVSPKITNELKQILTELYDKSNYKSNIELNRNEIELD